MVYRWQQKVRTADKILIMFIKMNITFPERVIVKKYHPRNMIINPGCTSAHNHNPWNHIFNYHPLREDII